MTQLNFTINQEEIQNLINEYIYNKIAKSILTKVFNELMEKERDEYLENTAYKKDPIRSTYRNSYYERDYTTKIGTITLRVPRTRDGKFRAQVFWKISNKWKSTNSNHARNVYSRSINKKSIQGDRKYVQKNIF